MTNAKLTKKALLSSALSLVLCISMLLGTTYAWFTDSVSSGNNIIQSGNLDIEFEYWDGEKWADVAGQSDILTNNLWEIINIPSMGGDVFQIDANLAYVASVCEMLIQSHEDAIAIIPALPDRWHTGSFRGLRARGGYEINAEWKNCSINKISVRSEFLGTCRIELPSTQRAFTFCDESGKVYQAENSIITIEATKSITLIAYS